MDLNTRLLILLNKLSEPQFGRLRSAFKGCHGEVAAGGGVSPRASQLLDWLHSPASPGLGEFLGVAAEVLDEIGEFAALRDEVGGAPLPVAAGAVPPGGTMSEIAASIRILFVAANPDADPRRLAKEFHLLQERIRRSERRDTLHLIPLFDAQPENLQPALLEHRPHVLHFSGHGSPSESLVLLDDRGGGAPVAKPAFVELLRVLRDELRLVVLNACHSRPIAAAVVQHIDVAIGMSRAISDEAAIQFSGAFYEALGYGRSLQTAFDLGRVGIMLPGISEESTPQLLCRDGVNPESIFLGR